jgi:virginiamycin B lyase
VTAALAVLAAGVLLAAGLASGSGRRVVEFGLRDQAHSTHEITLGPDGNVWVTQQANARIVRLTPAGHRRFFNLPRNSAPHGIRFDSAGHLWITLEATDEIAELDRGGHFLHRYPIRRPRHTHIGPHGLALAPDGGIWWTGKFGDVVGRLDPRTGRMRVFPLPHRASTPIYIASGCGGMYFTELDGSRIGRITNAGRITEYRTPTPHSRPIAVAPRGCKVWFSEEAGGHFGVLDARTHRIREYPLPHPTDQLAALAFDPRGNLWLQFKEPDAFGRVDARKRVHMLALPTHAAVMHRIIVGPGGNMWFTELMTDKVGYFDPR